MKLIMFTTLTIILLSFLGCRKQKIDGFTQYTIKKGKHKSSHGVMLITSDNIKFEARFDESAKYESINPVNQLDINKLFGFSECNQFHQKNSARFGWRWVDEQIEIHAYVYNDGIRVSQYITSVGIDETHQYEIEVAPNEYTFSVDNKSVKMVRTSNCERGLYYKLYPYFGGDEKAPHKITILIKEEGNNR